MMKQWIHGLTGLKPLMLIALLFVGGCQGESDQRTDTSAPSKDDETMFISTIQQYIDNAKTIQEYVVSLTNNPIHFLTILLCIFYDCFHYAPLEWLHINR